MTERAEKPIDERELRRWAVVLRLETLRRLRDRGRPVAAAARR
ncbi:hypothetical protein Q6348_08655 [Isoptericola sp. b441]|uniref:IS481 family transposase n=1 Tax=Actinotalea lenta TaxID=3064654 RepID=A0ABT9D8P3_9CELL|nr:hypothetical protein [Isoptericola sp. b441]MDO8107264.1 hypothetical protein [Isoptericola sp. b441]